MSNKEKESLNETISSLRADLRAEHQSSSAFIATLTCASLDPCLVDSKITHLEDTVQELNVQLTGCHNKSDSLIRIIHAHEQIHQCEALYVQGRIYDAAESVLALANTIGEDLRANKTIIDWLASEFQHQTLKESIQTRSSEFTRRCATTLERVGDEASNAKKQDEAISAYFAALSLSSLTPHTVLVKWASMTLVRGSANEVLSATAKVCFT